MAGSMKSELQSAKPIAVHRAARSSPAPRIHAFRQTKVAIQTGICAQRISRIASAPGESVSHVTGAKRNQDSGVWCSQKSRYGTRPSAIQLVARWNSSSSQFSGWSLWRGRRRIAAALKARAIARFIA